MTVSSETAQAITKALLKRVGERKSKEIVEDLLKISGNSSFKETVRLVESELNSQMKRRAKLRRNGTMALDITREG